MAVFGSWEGERFGTGVDPIPCQQTVHFQWLYSSPSIVDEHVNPLQLLARPLRKCLDTTHLPEVELPNIRVGLCLSTEYRFQRFGTSV